MENACNGELIAEKGFTKVEPGKPFQDDSPLEVRL
jgi:hypothetical protein